MIMIFVSILWQKKLIQKQVIVTRFKKPSSPTEASFKVFSCSSHSRGHDFPILLSACALNILKLSMLVRYVVSLPKTCQINGLKIPILNKTGCFMQKRAFALMYASVAMVTFSVTR